MTSLPNKYCIDLHNYERFPTRQVMVGGIAVGNFNPIRVQSMTNIPVENIEKSVEQAKKIFDSGADFVRFATPRFADVEHLKEIKKRLISENYNNPLIADVHFNPIVAEEAAKIVEKIRINPGNYYDKRASFIDVNYTEVEYKAELEKMHQKLLPLIKICKENGTAIRIGSNHGSLSDRILTRYGNTVHGMVEAAMEFMDIFISESFYNLVISMKASDVRTMVKACRLLNGRMLENSCIFPQHIGVTEAGEGEDGRLKSAIGIGSLLTDGIGDTIRVSLTESPEKEIPIAKIFADQFSNREFIFQVKSKTKNSFDPYHNKINTTLLNSDYIVISNYGEERFDEADFIYSEKIRDFNIEKKYILPYDKYLKTKEQNNLFPLINLSDQRLKIKDEKTLLFLELTAYEINNPVFWDIISENEVCLIIKTLNYPVGEVRYANRQIHKSQKKIPIIVKYNTDAIDEESTIAELGVFPGSVLVDSLITGLWIKVQNKNMNAVSLSYDLLQATGLKLNKAEFISCPACGRTQYDIEKACKKVKSNFSHLKGLKIAVMGCLVNGPGEMADANYGCVGSKKNHVHIYRGKKIVEKNIHENDILKALERVIKKNNDWKEVND